MNEPMSPWEALKNFITSWSLSEAIWILIGISCVFIFYSMAIRRKRRFETTWMVVLFWLISLLGWIFIMYMVARHKIKDGGVFALIVLLSSAFLIVVTTYLLTKKTLLWEKIVSGVIIAIIGFGTIATFGTGREPIGYSLVMGSLLGLILGMIISSIRDMHRKLNEELDSVVDKKRKTDKKKWRPKDVKEI